MLDYINKRQSELESERKELTAYQALDKQRRALEYALCDHELSKVKEVIFVLHVVLYVCMCVCMYVCVFGKISVYLDTCA